MALTEGKNIDDRDIRGVESLTWKITEDVSSGYISLYSVHFE